jgi:hypothetical protein
MYFSIYDVFYSQCSHQHVSAGISTIFVVMLLLQECTRTNKHNCVTITSGRNILVRTLSIKHTISTQVHLFVICILKVWFIHGRWNILKKYVRKFSRLKDWCRMEYDVVSTCKLLLTLRRTEIPSSSGICSPRRDRQDEGSVFLQMLTAVYHSTQRMISEHPNNQHRLCEKLEWRKE